MRYRGNLPIVHAGQPDSEVVFASQAGEADRLSWSGRESLRREQEQVAEGAFRFFAQHSFAVIDSLSAMQPHIRDPFTLRSSLLILGETWIRTSSGLLQQFVLQGSFTV